MKSSMFSWDFHGIFHEINHQQWLRLRHDGVACGLLHVVFGVALRTGQGTLHQLRAATEKPDGYWWTDGGLVVQKAHGFMIYGNIWQNMVNISIVTKNQWIGFLGKILAGNPWVFTIKYRGFRLKLSHHTILWSWFPWYPLAMTNSSPWIIPEINGGF